MHSNRMHLLASPQRAKIWRETDFFRSLFSPGLAHSTEKSLLRIDSRPQRPDLF